MSGGLGRLAMKEILETSYIYLDIFKHLAHQNLRLMDIAQT